MSVIETIKKTFKIVIENPNITLCLVLFLILSNFLIAYIPNITTGWITTVLTLCVFFATSAFFSGWFEIAKETKDIEKLKEKKVSTTFFEGIGKNIIPVTLGVIFSAVLFNLLLYALRIVAVKVFGTLDFLGQDMSTLPQDAESIKAYIQSLSADKLYAIYGWALSGLLVAGIYGFLLLFYMPAIINNQKNNMFLKPIIGIKDGICFVFKNFTGTLAIYLLITTLYLTLALINALFAKNTILSILSLFVYIYFISFVIVLIFNYYEQKNNNPDRTDSLGEDQCLDCTSKEV